MGIGGFVDDVLGLSPEVSAVAGIDALEMLRSFQDQISGVEQVEVTNPDGSRSIVTRKLPQSAEERAFQQQLEEGLTGLLAQATELSEMGVAADSEAFKPIVDASTELMQAEIDRQASEASKNQEEVLASRGLSGSTVGAQQRSALAGEVARASSDVQQQGILLGEQLRTQALGNTLSALQPFQQQQANQQALEQSALNRGTGIQLSLAQQELQRQLSNQNTAQFNSNQKWEQSQIATQTGMDLLSGGFQGLSGGSSSGGGGDLGSMVQMGMTLGSMFSDERLKENIKLLRKEKDINIYSYNYVWDETPIEGVMAQELLNVLPEAVHTDPSGYYKVDYTKVGEYLNG